MNEKIKCIAEDSMDDLAKQVYKWASEDIYSVEISVQDLMLMINHIEDLEFELFSPQDKS